MKLYEQGAYLINGTDVIIDSAEAGAQVAHATGKEVSKEQAKENTIAYGILKDHNTSGNMDKLQIKFDKLTSHDITFVGIIQTARASGLEKFPIPYVLPTVTIVFVPLVEPSTRMIICLVLPVQRNTAEFTFHLIRQSFISLQERC